VSACALSLTTTGKHKNMYGHILIHYAVSNMHVQSFKKENMHTIVTKKIFAGRPRYAACVGFQLHRQTWPSRCFHLLDPARWPPLRLTRRYQLGVGVSRFMSQLTDLLCTRAERVGRGRSQATRMQRAVWPSGQTSRLSQRLQCWVNYLSL